MTTIDEIKKLCKENPSVLNIKVLGAACDEFLPQAIRVMEQMAEAMEIHFALLPDAEDHMRKALAAFDTLKGKTNDRG